MSAPPRARPRRALGAVLVPALAGIAACAGGPPAGPIAGLPASLVGAPAQRAIARYGEPDERREEGGATVLRWHYRSVRLEPGRPEPPTVATSRTGQPVVVPGRRAPPALSPASCTLEMRLGPGGRVATWRAEGDACLEVLDSPDLWR